MNTFDIAFVGFVMGIIVMLLCRWVHKLFDYYIFHDKNYRKNVTEHEQINRVILQDLNEIRRNKEVDRTSHPFEIKTILKGEKSDEGVRIYLFPESSSETDALVVYRTQDEWVFQWLFGYGHSWWVYDSDYKKSDYSNIYASDSMRQLLGQGLEWVYAYKTKRLKHNE